MNTWSFVQSDGGGGSGGGAGATNPSATAGNLLVAVLKCFAASGVGSTFAMSITGVGNTIEQTPDASISSATDYIGIYSATLVTGGSVSVEGTGSTGNYALDMYEFSFGGSGTVSAVSPVSNSGASGIIGNAGTVVPTGNALLFSAFTSTSNQTQAAGSGWTLGSEFAGASGIPSSLQQYVLNTASPLAAVTGDVFSSPWIGAGVAYQVTAPVTGMSSANYLLQWMWRF
jgi:hypothetical protein